MSRYTGPSWKVSRRLGISLSGTGKELARRPYKPGQHGPNSRGKVSEYGMQLTEKQKLRHMYGMNDGEPDFIVNSLSFRFQLIFSKHLPLF